MIACGTWLATNSSPHAGGARWEHGRVVYLHRPRRGGQISRQWLVMGKREVAPNYVLRGFPRKIGLRIGWGDEWRVGCGGRERALGYARFCAAQDRAENRNEEIAALLSEDISERAIGDARWDRLYRQACLSTSNAEYSRDSVRWERVREHRPRQCHRDVSFR